MEVKFSPSYEVFSFKIWLHKSQMLLNTCISSMTYILFWKSSKINSARSVSQIMCSLQTAINPINLISY